MKTRAITVFLIFLLWPIVAPAQQPKVDLAQGMANATPTPALVTKSELVITIPTNGELFIANDLVARDQLGGKIKEFLKGRRQADRIVYLAGSRSLEYAKVVEVLKITREQDVDQFRLVVKRGDFGEMAGGSFLIMVPSLHDLDEDMANLKPNPLTLVVTVSTEFELKLNADTGPGPKSMCFRSAPNGLGNDPNNLQKWLACLFDSRTKQHAYKIGMETRTDLPEKERVEKTVFVKAPGSIRYGDVLRVVNALQSAGANPIGLQIDDLPN